MIIIGIDTGVNTGFATFNTETKESECLCLLIHEALEKVNSLQRKGEKLFVCVEDARKRKWVQGGREKLQGVGSVKRDAKIWEDFLTQKKIPFRMIAPKNNRTKLTKETFQSYTGYKGKTNEHSRDAYMLIYGMSEKDVQAYQYLTKYSNY